MTTIRVAIKILYNYMSTEILKLGKDVDEQQNWLEVVRRHVSSLRYGVVQIIIHDSQVTQIEKTERVRFDRAHSQTHLR
jgi:hypothetical protein